jgi:serine/threonine protein kinase/WD40 repeat protein
MNDSLPEDDLPTQGFSDSTGPPDDFSDDLPTPQVGGARSDGAVELPAIPGYAVLEVLGRGGMGVVYRARDLTLKRLVALKVLRGGSENAVALARFRREAAVMARLTNPGIVQVYELGNYRDPTGVERPYIAFELVRGASLDRLLRKSVLPPKQAAELVLALARTMQAVHKAGIVHRDLKPANVLLSASFSRGSGNREDEARFSEPRLNEETAGDATPKLTDFGLAHLRDASDEGLTRSGELLGTPGYMAPEQITGGASAEPAVDVHALGAILYECLTGRPPFKGASLHETLEQVTRHDPVPVRRLVPKVPRDLEIICLKCLEKEPGHRYSCAAALADDLACFIEGRAIRARPVSLAGRGWRWARRQPLLAALTGILLLLVAGGIVAAVWIPARLAALRGAARTAEAEAAAATEVAATHEYDALVEGVSARAANLEPNWPSRGLDDLARAAAVNTRVRDHVVLRTQAAACLGAVDISPVARLRPRFSAGQLAFDPTRPVLAVAQFKGWFYCDVVLMDVPTGKVLHRLRLRSASVWQRGEPVQDSVSSLAFSPDGRWLVAGSRSGRLHRWDIRALAPAAKPDEATVTSSVWWQAHDQPVECLCFCPAGHGLFSSAIRSVKRWSISDGWKQTQELATAGAPAASLAVAPGALLVGDNAHVHALRPEDLKALRPPSGFSASRVACAAGTNLAAIAAGPSVWLFDPATGRKGLRLRRPGLDASHIGLVDDLTFSPEGSLLASVSQQTKHICIWETASGRRLADYTLVDGTCRVAFDATGRWLTLLSDHHVHLHEVRPAQAQTLAALQVRPVHAAVWLDNGRELACIAGDRWSIDGVLGVWSIARPALPPRLRQDIRMPEPRLPVHLAVDRTRRGLAWTEDRAVVRGPLDDLRRSVQRSTKEVHGLVFAPDDRLWLADELRIRCLQGDRLRPGVSWRNIVSDRLLGLGTLWGVATGQRRILVAGRDGAVRLLCPDRAGLLATFRLGNVPACAVALNQDESRALVGMWDGAVRLLDLPGGRITDLPVRHRDRVGVVAFLGSDRAVTGSGDGMVRLWRRHGASFEEWLSLPMRAAVERLSATPDGRRLAVVLAGERAVRVWHLDRLEGQLRKLGLD